MSAGPTEPTAQAPRVPPHQVYDASAHYDRSAAPNVDFGSTKGKHVRGNCNGVEFRQTTGYKPLRARKMATAAAEAGQAE